MVSSGVRTGQRLGVCSTAGGVGRLQKVAPGPPRLSLPSEAGSRKQYGFRSQRRRLILVSDSSDERGRGRHSAGRGWNIKENAKGKRDKWGLKLAVSRASFRGGNRGAGGPSCAMETASQHKAWLGKNLILGSFLRVLRGRRC